MIELFYLNDAMQRMAAVQSQKKGQGPNPVSCMLGRSLMKSAKRKTIGIIFVLFGILFILLAWGGHFQSKKVIDKGGRAIAHITDKKIERSGRSYKDTGSTDFNVYYTFETKDGKAMAGRYPIRKETWYNLKIGDSIEVAYDFDNPNYSFPVSEDSLASSVMPAALSVFGLISIFVGGILFLGRLPFNRKPLPAVSSSEDIRVLRFLEKIKSHSASISFGSYHSHIVFSDGPFLEIADSLPAVIDSLHNLFTNRLSEDSIRQVLPEGTDEKAEKVQSDRMLSDRYKLSTTTHTCTIDAVYYDYLKMRYPQAEIFCRGPVQPVTFYQDGILRAVVMPMKE